MHDELSFGCFLSVSQSAVCIRSRIIRLSHTVRAIIIHLNDAISKTVSASLFMMGCL